MSKKNELIHSGIRLFGTHGFHAVGIDWILKEAGVAKMTLYNHFPSKDELIATCLRRIDEEIFLIVKKQLKKSQEDKNIKVEVFLKSYLSYTDKMKINCCLFQRALQEFSNGPNDILSIVKSHRQRVRNFFVELGYNEENVKDLHFYLDGLMLTQSLDKGFSLNKKTHGIFRKLLEGGE